MKRASERGFPGEVRKRDLAQWLLFRWLVIDPINLEYAVVNQQRLETVGS